jgi:hypothetical protein
VSVVLTAKGRDLVDAVTERRREEIQSVIAEVPQRSRAALVRALHALGDAASEPSDAAWFIRSDE